MKELSLHRTTAVALLVALNVVLAACGQQSGSSSATPVSSTAEGNTAVTAPSGDATAADAAASDGAPEGDVDTQATLISAMATATVLLGMQGGTPQAGLDLLSVDPCTLLTEDDVKSAMGDVSYTPKLLQHDDSYSTGCSYVEPTFGANSHLLTLRLEALDVWKGQPEDAQPVSGIGDAAYTEEFNELGFRNLFILLKNKVVVEIDIDLVDIEKAKQLASQAIGRLP